MSPASKRHPLARITGRARIYAAIPEGARRARSQPEWLRALDDAPEFAVLRRDAAENVRRVVWALGCSADWGTMVARPGWDTLTDRTGLSRSTIQRVLRRLREWGLLATVSTGSTWRTRGRRIDDENGNLAGEYVLTVPRCEAVDESDSPSLGSRREPEKPLTRTRETTPQRPRSWPMTRPPATRGDMLEAARRLQTQAPMLARISARRLRAVLRPWFVAGWTPRQVLHALDHSPDGEPSWHTADVRHVPGWIRHRLAAWDGRRPPAVLGTGYDLTPDQVAARRTAPRLPDAAATAHAATARARLAGVLQRLAGRRPAKVGLGIVLPDPAGRLEPTASGPGQLPGRNPYAPDDPRHRYAAAAARDAAQLTA